MPTPYVYVVAEERTHTWNDGRKRPITLPKRIGLAPSSCTSTLRCQTMRWTRMVTDPYKVCVAEVQFFTLTMNAHLAYRITSTLQLPAQGDPTVVSINPEGTLIAVGSVGGHVHVWCLSSYELLCQTSPPPEEGGSADAQIGNMAWMPNGLLVFSRRNGILGMLLVGKVRKWV